MSLKVITYIKIFFISMVLFLYACDKQNQPSSNCPAGYEGEFCDSLSYLKFIGNYRVSETCTSTLGPGPGNPQFTSTISQGFDIDMITISNFANRGLSIQVEIYDGRYLFINDQPTGAIQISGGQGEYERYTGRIELDYNYKVSGTGYQCTAVYYRF